MDIERKIVEILSPIFNNRVYPDIAPQTAIQNDLQPFCVYTLVTLSPTAANGCGGYVTQSTVQIDIYVSTKKMQIVQERIDFYKQVSDLLKENGFKFQQGRQGFDKELRLYRSSSDWIY